MPDVLDIVIVLQHINELLHILQVALLREGDVVLGLLPQGVQRFFTMAENYFFTHEPKLNIHHEYSVFSRKTPMYVATVLLAISITDSP